LLDPGLLERVRGQFRKEPEEDERLTRLTNQERRILLHIADGLTNRQIGEAMHLAEKTVKNYVSNLLAKLGMERAPRRSVRRTPRHAGRGPGSCVPRFRPHSAAQLFRVCCLWRSLADWHARTGAE
jgi:DNA-binding CsgD family transcriptional regulator